MDIKNLVLILVIICAVIGLIIYYIRALKKTTDDIEYESAYSLQHLTDGVAKEFADIQKTNLKEQNLSKRELESAKRKKLELRRSLKTAAFGDENAKKFIKSFIKDIITGPKYGVTDETIDWVIPFNHLKAIDARSKAEILFYIYKKKYGVNGLGTLMEEFGLNKPKDITSAEEEECGAMEYEITETDISRAFDSVMRNTSLTFDDKLEIVAQRIFADYKGFGPVDMLFEFSIDEIDCGVSGVPKGTYDLKKSMMTKDFEYSFNSIFIVFHGINYKLSCLTFGTQDELVRVCQNIYKFSAPYALSRKKGYVVGTMKDGSRIAVSRPPASGSWCFFARKFDSAPSASLNSLLTDENKELPITSIKWIMRTLRSVGITGPMGTGKTTTLKGMVRYIRSSKNIRVFEISPELNLQFTYPKRNITNFSTTESISMQELYDFGKKSNSNVNIVGESASAEMGVIVIQSATVGSEQAIFTHHAKTADDLILSLRDNLTSAGGYQSEKVAEEVVAKCINFNIHMGREKGHRYIERITEIIPIRDRRYPYDLNDETMTDKDTVEYYKRMTDRRAFTTRDIIRWEPVSSEDGVKGRYVMVNPISPEMMMEMRNSLTEEEEKLFLKDMEILESTMERKRA